MNQPTIQLISAFKTCSNATIRHSDLHSWHTQILTRRQALCDLEKPSPCFQQLGETGSMISVGLQDKNVAVEDCGY